MNFLTGIYLAVIENNDSNMFRKILYDNIKRTRNQPLNSKFMVATVSQVARSENEEIVDIFIGFLESEAQNCPQKQLLIAIFQGDVERAELLLKSGVEIVGGKWGEYFYLPAMYSSLLFRITSTRKKMLTLFIKYGLDIHLKSEMNCNLFHVVAASEHPDAVDAAEVLFDSGLKGIDELDELVYTPLSLAIECANFRLIEFFINKGADVNKSVDGQLLPLNEAVSKGNFEIIDLLLSSGAKINSQESSEGHTALHQACLRNKKWLIRFLIQKGADITIKDESGKTPIYLLKPGKENFKSSLVTMIREFSKLSFISKIDMDFIQVHPSAQEHFEKCVDELTQMENTKFYPPYSYYFVLNYCKNLKKLAELTKNEEFISAFIESLSLFPYFIKDLSGILEEAIHVRNDSLEVSSRLKSVFKQILPDLVIKILAEHLTLEDLPLL